jgi:hypothetical protein
MPKVLKKSIAEYITQWAGKKTTYDIASDLEVSFDTVRSYANDLGVSLVAAGSEERTEMIRAAVIKHHATMSITEIARMINVPYGTVKYHGIAQGVSFFSYKERGKVKEMEKPEDINGFFDETKYRNWLL